MTQLFSLRSGAAGVALISLKSIFAELPAASTLTTNGSARVSVAQFTGVSSSSVIMLEEHARET